MNRDVSTTETNNLYLEFFKDPLVLVNVEASLFPFVDYTC